MSEYFWAYSRPLKEQRRDLRPREESHVPGNGRGRTRTLAVGWTTRPTQASGTGSKRATPRHDAGGETGHSHCKTGELSWCIQAGICLKDTASKALLPLHPLSTSVCQKGKPKEVSGTLFPRIRFQR